MSKVQIEIGATIQGAQTGLDRLRGSYTAARAHIVKEAEAMARATQAMMGKGAGGGSAGKGGNSVVGQVSMQVQDIAVQLQGGTKLLTVMAQQGSQLLSNFGANGALLGGAVAVGGALLTVGQNAKEAFNTAIQGSSEFRKELDGIIASGSVAQITDSLQKLAEHSKALKSAVPGGFFGTLQGGLNVLVGGDSKAERQSKVLIEEGKLYWDKVKAEQALVDASGRELHISKLRLEGKKEEAEAAERSLKLQMRLAEIDQMPVAQFTKDALSSDAREQAATADKQAAAKRASDLASERDKKRKAREKEVQEAEADRKKETDKKAAEARKLGEIIAQEQEKADESKERAMKDRAAEARKIGDILADAQKKQADEEAKAADERKRNQQEHEKAVASSFTEKVKERLKSPEEKRAERAGRRDTDRARRSVLREEAIEEFGKDRWSRMSGTQRDNILRSRLSTIKKAEENASEKHLANIESHIKALAQVVSTTGRR